jgi:hypothetical protein
MTDCGLLAALEFSTLLAPQQTGIQVTEICAGVLLLLALLNLLVGWARHLSWGVRGITLLPLAASVAAGIGAHALQDTYLYWVNFLCYLGGSFPPGFQNHFLQGIADANHRAAVLGWVSAIVTGILLVLSGVGMWRLRGKLAT